MTRISSLSLLCLALGTFACTGNVGDPPIVGEPEPEPVLEPKTVAAELDTVAGDSFCVDLDNAETLWSVSPEGHAWLAKQVADTQVVRVVDPFDPSAPSVDTLVLDELREIRAWNAGDAAVLTGAGLWLLDDLARVQVTPPVTMATGTLCGDPGTNGQLLVDGTLYERRDDQWFVWSSGATGEASPSRILTFDGECLSTENATWMMADDGLLWKLLPSQVFWPLQAAAGSQATATADIVAVLEPERLMTGPGEWQPWLFEATTPTVMSASGGNTWLASGQTLMRFDGEEFVAVTHALQTPIEHVQAHPGGAWIVGGAQACHVSTAPMLRIEGVRSYGRSTELNYPFTVESSDPSATITASIDGEPIELTPDAELARLTGIARVDAVGWSHLTLESGGAVREVPLKRLAEVDRSWAEDIKPIYEAHCTGSTCHGGGVDGPPDLDTFEAWVSLATVLKSAVVDDQTMPPVSSRSAEWDDEEVTIILEWIEGGMLP